MILGLLALVHVAVKDEFQFPDHMTVLYMGKGLGLLVASFLIKKLN